MTQVQLNYINGLDSKKEIKKQLNRWFGEESKLEVGKWYKCNDDDVLCFKQSVYGGYGIFFNEWNNEICCQTFKDWTLATDKEVEEALIKEAVKRGYKLGVYVKGMDDGERCKLFGDIKLFGNDYVNIGYDIFRSGKWAEIIETITKKEAEKQLNKKIID